MCCALILMWSRNDNNQTVTDQGRSPSKSLPARIISDPRSRSKFGVEAQIRDPPQKKRSVTAHFSCFDTNLLRYMSSRLLVSDGDSRAPPPSRNGLHRSSSLAFSFTPCLSNPAYLLSVRRLTVDLCLWLILLFFIREGCWERASSPGRTCFSVSSLFLRQKKKPTKSC